MKKLFKKLLLLGLMLTMAFGFSACGDDDDDTLSASEIKSLIVGSWRYIETGIYTFREDDTGEYSEDFEDLIEFNYSIKGNKVHILYNNGSDEVFEVLSINNDAVNVIISYIDKGKEYSEKATLRRLL